MIDLIKHTKKIWSQKGEDGILSKICKELKIEKGHGVELGAWDGIKYSNIYNLIIQGWSATLIEGDEEKYKELCENMKSYPEVTEICSMVNLEEGNNLNEILKRTNTPEDFDILSLDLDGCDYWVWRDLKFIPKIVIVEYNSNWEKAITVPYNKNHCWDGTQFYGASASALTLLGKSKGYDLVTHIPYSNLIFLKSELNEGKFKCIDLSDNKHISKNHHKPMNESQIKSLVINPPV